jgi:hypothetical protein
MAVAGADGVRGGLDAMGHALGALHALGPVGLALAGLSKEASFAASAGPPTEPMVEVPPVVSKAALAPASALDFMDVPARAMARFKGEEAAAAPARATPPTPEAIPDTPDRPS